MKVNNVTITEKKLEKIQLEKMKLDQQYKSLIHRQKKADSKQSRRERTHRISTKGAMLEKYFDCSEYTFEDTEKLLKTFADFVNTNKPAYFKETYHNGKYEGNNKENKKS